jgi:hypothetical protein
LHVFHSRDHCFDLEIADNFLCCKNYEQVQCWDTETSRLLPPFLGISTFCVAENKLIGFSPTQRRFEVYALEDEQRTLITTLPDTTILNTTVLVYAYVYETSD